MQRMEEWEQIKKEYKETEIPKDGSRQVMEAMARAKRNRGRLRNLSRYATVAAAMLLILLIPNINSNAASAMAEVPVLGGFFRLITIERYVDTTETAVMEAEIPRFEAVVEQESTTADNTSVQPEEEKDVLYGAGSAVMDVQLKASVPTAVPETSVESMNQEIEDYVREIMNGFQQEKDAGELVSRIVSYEVVTNTGEWFCIRIAAETVKADGYMEYTYYTLHSDTKERVYLTDFLPTEDDRKNVGEEVLRQMEVQMDEDAEVHFFVDQLKQEAACLIAENQSFYINAEGHLVIAFNELEVAPGYMGCVEFIIPDELVPGLK